MDKETEERAIFATKVFCRLCEEHQIKTCSWEKSPVWNDYVEGRIDEAELSRRAESDVGEFVTMIREGKELEKSLVDPSSDDQKARRIKIANRIYRNVCTKSGHNNCFFKNFAAWSEYVNETIDENTFIESAIFEVQAMKKDMDVQKT